VTSSGQTRRRAVVRGAKGAAPSAWRPASVRGLACVLIAVVLAGCTDPRARPTPPSVQITLANGGVVASPGILRGTLHATDEYGLDSILVSIHSADERLITDSLYFASDAFDETRYLEWVVPAGMPDGIGFQVVARVVSYIRFSSADTVYGIIRHAASNAR